MEIRFLGHSCFELTEGDTRVLIDPFLTGNPKAAVERRRGRPHAHLPDARPRRPLRRHRWTSPSARAPRCVAIASSRTSWARPASRTWPTRTSAARSSSTGGWVRLTPAWHTSTTPERHGQHARRPRDQPRRQDRLPPRRHGALLRPAAGRPSATTIDVALMCIGGHYTMDRHDAVTAAELVGATHGDPLPLRHVPADRDRRRGVQGGRRGDDVVEGRRSWSRARASRARARLAPMLTGVGPQRLVARAALEPDRAVLPVVGDRRRRPAAAQRRRPVVPWCTRWPQIHETPPSGVDDRPRDYRVSMASRS